MEGIIVGKRNLWKVQATLIDGAICYLVYRLQDPAKTDHSGNREYYDGGVVYPNKTWADKTAEQLNEIEMLYEEER